MCGIVGGVARVQIRDILLQGLQKLEYRGYDSAGLAMLEADGRLINIKTKGKVSRLQEKLKKDFSVASAGIAHTRWATHGKPSTINSHPHLIADRIAIVHNGIIENYQQIAEQLIAQYPETSFVSETDTEVAGWYIYHQIRSGKKGKELFRAINKAFEGSYALLILDKENPNQLSAVRQGSPMVLGQGRSGQFIASDPIAIIEQTESLAILKEGDGLVIEGDKYQLYDSKGKARTLTFKPVYDHYHQADKGEYRHYMHKEIHQQPDKIRKTIESYSDKKRIHFPEQLGDIFEQTEHIHCIGCGTSYHALCIARYWIEELSGIACQVEVASEFRYRKTAVPNNTLFLTISQSGETADTLAALDKARKSKAYLTTLAICNSPLSSLVRNADHKLMTSAGIEVSVASTKAFTTQLALLFLLALQLADKTGKTTRISKKEQQRLLSELHQLPELMQSLLSNEGIIEQFSQIFINKTHSIFIGRGSMYPLAQEGALKLKEISYIYAEAYPAGELKHGPLALIDEETPVVVVSPPTQLLNKLHSNLEEVQSRGAVMLVFLDEKQKIKKRSFDRIIKIPTVDSHLAPLLYIIPLQLLAYQVAVHKGTDLDQPRNLAKSVTVE